MLALSDTEILLVEPEGKSGIWIRSDLYRTYFMRLYDKQKKQSMLYAACDAEILEDEKEQCDVQAKRLHLELKGNRETGDRIWIHLPGTEARSISIGEPYLVQILKQYLSDREA